MIVNASASIFILGDVSDGIIFKIFFADKRIIGEWVPFLFWVEVLIPKTVNRLQKQACYFVGIAHLFGLVGWPFIKRVWKSRAKRKILFYYS